MAKQFFVINEKKYVAFWAFKMSLWLFLILRALSTSTSSFCLVHEPVNAQIFFSKNIVDRKSVWLLPFFLLVLGCWKVNALLLQVSPWSIHPRNYTFESCVDVCIAKWTIHIGFSKHAITCNKRITFIGTNDMFIVIFDSNGHCTSTLLPSFCFCCKVVFWPIKIGYYINRFIIFPFLLK